MKRNIHYKVFENLTNPNDANKVFFVGDFKHCTLSLAAGAGVSLLNVQLLGAGGEKLPDFAQPVSLSNHYDTIQGVHLSGGEDFIDGDVGIMMTTPGVNLYEFNTNNLNWIAIKVISVTGGATDCTLQLTNNL